MNPQELGICESRYPAIWISCPQTLGLRYGFINAVNELDPYYWSIYELVGNGEGWLKLIIHEYQRTVEDIQGGNFTRTSAGSFISTATGSITLKLNCLYHQSAILYCIEEIFSIHNTSNYNVNREPTLLTMLDFNRPELKDRQIITNQDGSKMIYTERQGRIIPPIEELGGLIYSEDYRQYNHPLLGNPKTRGFSFTFKEAKKRIL